MLMRVARALAIAAVAVVCCREVHGALEHGQGHSKLKYRNKLKYFVADLHVAVAGEHKLRHSGNALTHQNYAAVLETLQHDTAVNALRMPMIPLYKSPKQYENSDLHSLIVKHAHENNMSIYASPMPETKKGWLTTGNWSDDRFVQWLVDYVDFFDGHVHFLSPWSEAQLNDSPIQGNIDRLFPQIRVGLAMAGHPHVKIVGPNQASIAQTEHALDENGRGTGGLFDILGSESWKVVEDWKSLVERADNRMPVWSTEGHGMRSLKEAIAAGVEGWVEWMPIGPDGLVTLTDTPKAKVTKKGRAIAAYIRHGRPDATESPISAWNPHRGYRQVAMDGPHSASPDAHSAPFTVVDRRERGYRMAPRKSNYAKGLQGMSMKAARSRASLSPQQYVDAVMHKQKLPASDYHPLVSRTKFNAKQARKEKPSPKSHKEKPAPKPHKEKPAPKTHKVDMEKQLKMMKRGMEAGAAKQRKILDGTGAAKKAATGTKATSGAQDLTTVSTTQIDHYDREQSPYSDEDGHARQSAGERHAMEEGVHLVTAHSEEQGARLFNLLASNKQDALPPETKDALAGMMQDAVAASPETFAPVLELQEELGNGDDSMVLAEVPENELQEEATEPEVLGPADELAVDTLLQESA